MTANGCQDKPFPLTLEKEETTLTTITYREKKNGDATRRLLNSTYLREIHETKQKEKGFNNISHESGLLQTIYEMKEVKYSRAKHGWGRVSPVKGLSVGSLRRLLRGTVCDGVYADADLQNAHPVILNQVLTSNGFNFSRLKQYVEKRDEVLKDTIEFYGLTDDEDNTARDKAKSLFLRLMYLGEFDEWLKENKVADKGYFTFPLEFKTEMEAIASKICDSNKALVSIWRNKQKEPGFNKKKESVVMSYWCQELERRCLEVMVETIDEKYRHNLVLCYDGMMIPVEIFDDLLMLTMEKNIREKLGLKLRITKKEFNTYDVSGFEPMNIGYEWIKEKIEREDGLCWVRDVKSYFFRDSKGVVSPFTEAQLKAEYRVQPYGFLKTWLDDIKRKTYDRVDYIIDKELCPERVLNLREPMAFDNFTGRKPDASFDLIQKHIDLLTGGNLRIFEDFLAYRVRNPDTLVPIAFLIKATQGVGKSRLFQDICKYWFNEKCFNEAQSIEQAGLGTFNRVLEGKIFNVWAEVNGKAGYSQEDPLKNLITNPTLLIHPKGKEMYEVSNKINWVVLTNNEVSIKITDEDRRWYVFSASPELKAIKTPEGRRYFQTLSTQTDNPLCWEAYYYYLKHEHTFNHEINIPDDFQAYIPETEQREEMIEQAMPMAFQFFTDQFKDEPDDTTEVRTYVGIMRDFNEWRIRNHRSSMNSSGVGAQLNQVHCLQKHRTKRGNTYSISVQEFWRELENRFGI